MRRLLMLVAMVWPGLLGAQGEAIFNGRDLDGWKVQGAAYWKVEEGVIVGESDQKKRNSILWTDSKFEDFRLSYEFRFSGDVDSGVFLRHENEQIQIGTSRSLKRDMTCSPYIANKRCYPEEAKGVKDLLKQGEWNRMVIEVRGGDYAVTLNGQEVILYHSDSSRKKGPIGLQVHPGVMMRVEFRGLAVEALD